MAALSDYLENKLIDFTLRGQAFAQPTSVYFGLLTSAPSDAGGGTEVSLTGTAYARVQVNCTLANFAGTQSAGSTAASTGTSGQTSNNGPVTFGVPTANWGTITHIGIYDSVTGGNLLVWGALAQSKTVNNGDAAPSFAAGSFVFQIDN